MLDDRLRAIGDGLRENLEDFEIELLAALSRLAAETNSVNPAAAEGWPSAARDIERMFAAQGCKRAWLLGRANINEADF